MSRDDLLKANYDVVKAVVRANRQHSPNCILIVVTNPLDAMAQAALKVKRLPKKSACSDGGRAGLCGMSTFVAMECKVSVENVRSFVHRGSAVDSAAAHMVAAPSTGRAR